MICSTCAHLILRVYQNGRDREELRKCGLDGLFLKPQLVECNRRETGFLAHKEEDIYTKADGVPLKETVGDLALAKILKDEPAVEKKRGRPPKRKWL